MCVSTRERNQFPSVLLQPLGHLSALESMTCERSDRDYRTRRTLPLPFLHCVSFQRFTGREGGHRPGIVSASLSRAITYGDFVELASRLARRTCVSIPRLTWRGGPVDGNGNDCVTIVRCRFSSISTEQDRVPSRLGFKGSMPQQRRDWRVRVPHRFRTWVSRVLWQSRRCCRHPSLRRNKETAGRRHRNGSRTMGRLQEAQGRGEVTCR
jgi:hypothetical protein